MKVRKFAEHKIILGDVISVVDDYVEDGSIDLIFADPPLPFGKKLQNHALNHRLNQEFKKYFPTCDYVPVIREPSNNRYWFNENLLLCIIEEQTYNLAKIIIQIIELYILTKTHAFEILPANKSINRSKSK